MIIDDFAFRSSLLDSTCVYLSLSCEGFVLIACVVADAAACLLVARGIFLALRVIT